MRERAQARNFFLQLYFRLDSALARHRLHPVKDFRFGCVCENGEIAQLFDTQFPPCKNRSSGFFLQGGLGRRATQSLAEVAELADAHGSGPCTRKGVGVRVPSSAPVRTRSFDSFRSLRISPRGSDAAKAAQVRVPSSASDPLAITGKSQRYKCASRCA